METKIISGRKVYIIGEGGPLFAMGYFKDHPETAQEIYDRAKEAAPEKPFTLMVYETENWNADFSPWEAPGVMGDEKFDGEGPATLAWLKNALNELAEPDRDIYPVGYSLAGLFALWALYEDHSFKGCACNSGSLWFEGWQDYIASHTLPEDCIIYLSLGGKEEKTKNPIVATIGDATRGQDKLFDRDKNVRKHKLIMNPGGHFSDEPGRVAKSIAWLLENM